MKWMQDVRLGTLNTPAAAAIVVAIVSALLLLPFYQMPQSGMGCYISKINILHELRSKHKYTFMNTLRHEMAQIFLLPVSFDLFLRFTYLQLTIVLFSPYNGSWLHIILLLHLLFCYYWWLPYRHKVSILLWERFVISHSIFLLTYPLIPFHLFATNRQTAKLRKHSNFHI